MSKILFLLLTLYISNIFAECTQQIYTNHESKLDLIKIDQKHERDKKVFKKRIERESDIALELGQKLAKKEGDKKVMCQQGRDSLGRLSVIKKEVDELYNNRTKSLQKEIADSVAHCSADPGLEYFLQDMNNMIKYEFHSYRSKAKTLRARYKSSIEVVKTGLEEIVKKTCF